MNPPRRTRARPGPGGVPKRLTLPRTLLLDADGLSKAATGDSLARGLLRKAVAEDADVVVSAVTLTETLRGTPRDVAVRRLLKDIEVRDVTAEVATAAGLLLGSTGGANTVDAIVAATAAGCAVPVLVLTSDPGDLGVLVDAMPAVSVVSV